MKSQRQKTPNKIDESLATDRERKYAASIGVQFPEGATRSDAQALIARELDNDDQASSGLLAYAREKGMKCSDYIGNKYLHNLLFDNLEKQDQVTFFCFCVYKFHEKLEHENLLESEHAKVFEAFGESYSKDGYFMASLEDYYGEELVAFGKSDKITSLGKKTIYGGSIHTRAYKITLEYLKSYVWK